MASSFSDNFGLKAENRWSLSSPLFLTFSSHLHMHRYVHMISMVRIQTNSTPWSTIFHVLHYSRALQATLSSLVLGWCSDHLHRRDRDHNNHRGRDHNNHPGRDRLVILQLLDKNDRRARWGHQNRIIVITLLGVWCNIVLLLTFLMIMNKIKKSCFPKKTAIFLLMTNTSWDDQNISSERAGGLVLLEIWSKSVKSAANWNDSSDQSERAGCCTIFVNITAVYRCTWFENVR